MQDNILINDGFKLRANNHIMINISPISLKIALKAYLSTYHAIKYNFILIENPSEFECADEEVDRNYFNDYYEYYSETITHFHHFIELTLKEILQNKHELLAGELTDPVILYKFLSKEINKEDLEKYEVKALGFSDTLKRICTLIKEDVISKSEFKFILDNQKWLENLANLRNRLLHRGMYILRYKSFDKLIGKYILPFILKLITIYKDGIPEHFWKHKKIDCGIDPITEIVNSFENDSYDMGKIALLKELGRAAYNNNLTDGFLDKIHLHKNIVFYENAAKEYKIGVSDIQKCPVCGINTLLILDDYEVEQDADENYICAYSYVWSVRCIQCGFELHNNIQNPKEYGYNNISQWFWSKEIYNQE